MTDNTAQVAVLVKQLREVANGMRGLRNERGDYALADSAADEIERLVALASPPPAGDIVEREAHEWLLAKSVSDNSNDCAQAVTVLTILHERGAITPPAGAMVEAAWQPIETAPKSTSTEIEGGHFVRGIYLLGFCPEEGARLEGCISVIWWEPNLHDIGKGGWINDGDMEVQPTHWMPLPAPPSLATPAPGEK